MYVYTSIECLKPQLFYFLCDNEVRCGQNIAMYISIFQQNVEQYQWLYFTLRIMKQ